jgi:hypothetical protein
MASVPLITPDEIKAIMPTTLSDNSLVVFIDTGTALANEIFSSAIYSDERIKQIAMFLIAHLCATASPQMQSETIDGYRYEITGKFSDGLKSTSYGQTAIMLDTKGVLEGLSKKKASMTAFDIRVR